jgi:hypothetical protein
LLFHLEVFGAVTLLKGLRRRPIGDQPFLSFVSNSERQSDPRAYVGKITHVDRCTV